MVVQKAMRVVVTQYRSHMLDRVLQRLESLSYPVVPQLELGMADVAEAVRQAASQSPVAKAVQTSEGADAGSEDDDEQEEQEEEENAAVSAAYEAVRTKLDAWCQQQVGTDGN